MNKALLEEYQIQHLVTKESGDSGGFQDKVEAAKECGASLIVLRRPKEQGYFYSELMKHLTEETGGSQ